MSCAPRMFESQRNLLEVSSQSPGVLPRTKIVGETSSLLVLKRQTYAQFASKEWMNMLRALYPACILSMLVASNQYDLVAPPSCARFVALIYLPALLYFTIAR
jgi:hypothetical protein